MKCQILISGKNKKNVISLLCAELAQRVVKVKKHRFLNILRLKKYSTFEKSISQRHRLFFFYIYKKKNNGYPYWEICPYL